MPRERSVAFAPGRVNLIGDHTDYNEGLALPFAIAEGVTVRAHVNGTQRVQAEALDLGECDDFPLLEPPRAEGWRAFVRGVVAELGRAGFPLVGARLEIDGRVPLGMGLSSSAALEVALCLALVELGRDPPPGGEPVTLDRTRIAVLCSQVENQWVGAHTGLLDQLASLYGAVESALCIDFRTLSVRPVALELGAWSLMVLDSGDRHEHASSGYNERRAECARACELLGIASLRDADSESVARLPMPLRARAQHVIAENQRVLDAVAALAERDLPALGELLNASHASLRDLYEVSTPHVDAAVARLREAGASGARMSGGGFGGIVLGLFAPDTQPPADARAVRPSAGAHVVEPGEGGR